MLHYNLAGSYCMLSDALRTPLYVGTVGKHTFP